VDGDRAGHPVPPPEDLVFVLWALYAERPRQLSGKPAQPGWPASHRVLISWQQAKVRVAIVVRGEAASLGRRGSVVLRPATRWIFSTIPSVRRRQGWAAGKDATGKPHSRWGCTCFFFNTPTCCLMPARGGVRENILPKDHHHPVREQGGPTCGSWFSLFNRRPRSTASSFLHHAPVDSHLTRRAQFCRWWHQPDRLRG